MEGAGFPGGGEGEEVQDGVRFWVLGLGLRISYGMSSADSCKPRLQA